MYEQNRKKRELDRDLFQTPTAEYRGTPFWAWNCDLEEIELLRQIDVFKEMGFGGFHMHVRTGMSTPYLSEDFFKLVKACTKHAKEKNMLAWLYDEDRWPSGAAGGFVTKDKGYRQRTVVFSCNPNYQTSEDTEILARFEVCLDENKHLASYRRLKEAEMPQTGVLWTCYREIAKNDSWYNNQAYLDTLNPKAVEKFVSVTHDAYKKAVGEEFGKTIPAIFTDEPQVARKQTLSFADSKQDVSLPWTDDLEHTYFATYQSSLIDHLPELLWDLPQGEVSTARYRYHDHLSERFASAFADTCGAWCQKNGILFTGHMMEEPTLHSQTAALGEAMRSYRSFDIPGIDMLCAKFELTTAKQAQSAKHQYGRAAMMSELYGVTGWDFDFRGHKLHGDWQAALGVTVRVPHLSWVSMKGNAKRDYPASISYQSSWYKKYAYVEDHFARLNTALTRGQATVRVGVVHPIESYWLHFGPAEQTALKRQTLDEHFKDVTNWLLYGAIDFDYISESLLPSLCKKGGAPLEVGEMKYDAIIVPGCETLRESTLARLNEFKNAGGTLIFMGDSPKYIDAIPSDEARTLYEKALKIPFSRGALLEAVEPFREVEIRKANGALCDHLLHQLRTDEKGRWLFICHGREPYNKDVSRSETFKVTLKGDFSPQLWNTQTGEVSALNYISKNGRTSFSISLYDYDSALLFLPYEMKNTPLVQNKMQTNAVEFVPQEVAYSLSEPNVLLLDIATYSLDGDDPKGPEEILRADNALRDKLGFPRQTSHVAQPWVIEKKVPTHKVTLTFEIESEIYFDTPMLALEDAEVAQIVFNGKAVTYKDEGYYTDIAIRKTALPPLQKGINTLQITLPYGERTNIEACYILGDFGVNVLSTKKKIVALPKVLSFDDICKQSLPFYGGEVRYHIPLSIQKAGDYALQIPHYRAGVLDVCVDGKDAQTVAYPPYMAKMHLSEGEHTVTVTAYISRHNCFGHIHCADAKLHWLGPDCWRTSGSAWTYGYRLREAGVLTTPLLWEIL